MIETWNPFDMLLSFTHHQQRMTDCSDHHGSISNGLVMLGKIPCMKHSGYRFDSHTWPLASVTQRNIAATDIGFRWLWFCSSWLRAWLSKGGALGSVALKLGSWSVDPWAIDSWCVWSSQWGCWSSDCWFVLEAFSQCLVDWCENSRQAGCAKDLA